MNEKFLRIGDKILNQVELEKKHYSPDKSIGLIDFLMDFDAKEKWILRNPKSVDFIYLTDITGARVGTKTVPSNSVYTHANCVSRDSVFGGKVIMKGVGQHKYNSPDGKIHNLVVKILSTYQNSGSTRADALNGKIILEEDSQEFSFSSLFEELHQLRGLEVEKTNLEKLLHEEKEREKESDQAKRLLDSIEKKNLEIARFRERISKYFQTEVELRDRPFLDEYQEVIKRYKILNGPLIINGGPGTGKTTSLIQRITYLTSETIKEVVKISEEGERILFDQLNSWVFFSPSDLLRDYLANAMIAEGLAADRDRVKTWKSNRLVLLRETMLINPDKKLPFTFKSGDGDYFKDGADHFIMIRKLFLNDYITSQKEKIKRLHNETIDKNINAIITDETSSVVKQLGLLIDDMRKSSVHVTNMVNSIGELITFFMSFQQRFSDRLSENSKKITETINDISTRLQVMIERRNIGVYNWIKEYIKEESQKQTMPEGEDSEPDEDEQIIESEVIVDYERAIDARLKRLLRNLALNMIDPSNNPISKSNKDLLAKVEAIINDSTVKNTLPTIGVRLYFKKIFEASTLSVERNLLTEIPKAYKRFRKSQLHENAELLTLQGLVKCKSSLEKDNVPIYPQEADFLLYLIFGICRGIYKSNKNYFETSNHPYILAYRNNIKGVVAIDEATDFSIWELVVMTQLSHPMFNSVTLSGDLMQRMTPTGIKSWEEYTKIFKDTEIKDLKIAYRQTAKLLRIATAIYKKNVNSAANFIAHHKDPLDPEPLVCVSSDEAFKHMWLTDRIMEIQRIYGSKFPTVAIFVRNDQEVIRIADLLNKFDDYEEAGLEVTPCIHGNVLGKKQNIRVYSIEYIKGLEFGAVFFLDLDKLPDHDLDLLNKYLYVGLSRANIFLGVTFENGYPANLEYLKPLFKSGDWKGFTNN
jgi:hypothetical protein